MRLSSDRGDPGYADAQRLQAVGRVNVYLDCVLQRFVVLADEEAGLVVVLAQLGGRVFHRRGAERIARIYRRGRVEIVVT